MSKHAIEGLTKALAVELAERGVRVNAVAPGNVFEGSKIWNPEYIKVAARKKGIEWVVKEMPSFFHVAGQREGVLVGMAQSFTDLQRRQTEASRIYLERGYFKDEIVPVSIPQPKGPALNFDTDEFPRFGTTLDALAKLKPAFQKDGTVTAGNSSGINDGAAAVGIVSKKKLADLKPNWAFQVLGYQAVGLDPAYMGLGPIGATKKLLAKLKLTINDLDLMSTIIVHMYLITPFLKSPFFSLGFHHRVIDLIFPRRSPKRFQQNSSF
jgi:hypothetical protein